MTIEDSRGLFIGRFQPFHLGHLEASKYALGIINQIVIVVGSAQYSHTLENPFTAGERVTMMKSAFDEAGLDRSSYFIIPVEDINYHSIWVHHIRSLTPKFKVLFSNDPLTMRLFKEAGVKVEPIPFFNREIHSSTEIRARIINGGDWESLVPLAVAHYIKEIGGLERIKEISSTDKVNM